MNTLFYKARSNCDSSLKYMITSFLFGFLIPISNALTHSYSYGFFILAIFIHVIYKIRFNKKIFFAQMLAYIFLLFQTSITSGWNEKALVSGIVMIYCAGIYYSFGILFRTHNRSIPGRAFLYSFFIISFLALISFTLSKYFGLSLIYTSAKPAFPFQEPSHLALYMCPIIFSLLSIAHEKVRGIIVILLFLFCFYFQSLIFAAFAFLALFLILKKRGLVNLSIFFVLTLFLFFFIDHMYASKYMFTRINSLFSAGTVNMSALVYLQGWESVRETIITSPLGVGFQYLGNEPPNNVSIYIKSLAGEFVNRQDGGFLFAKLFSELGFFSIVILIATVYWIKFNYAKAILLDSVNIKPAFYIFVSLIVPLLFRDVGYFSYTFFYFFTFCGYLYASSRQSYIKKENSSLVSKANI